MHPSPGRTRGPLKARRPPLPLILGGIGLVALVAWILGGYGDVTEDPPELVAESPASGITTPSATYGPPLDPDLQLVAARSFWDAVGTGDTAGALSLLDPDGGAPLSNVTAFLATFRAGFDPSECGSIASNAVRCTITAGNQDLIAVYYSRLDADEYSDFATVTFGDEGIVNFEFPGLVAISSVRLATLDGGVAGMPAPCSPDNYDAEDLSESSVTLAQTADCGRALTNLLPVAVAAID